MRRLFAPLLLTSLLAAAPASAQIQSRPTDQPIVTANNESWYLNREPVQFGGDLYYPAGATVFFNGNHMVRSGHYNGVPLYTDTTIEPFSIVYVPLERGMMQPYERVREGSVAGTTGSRPPSFPVAATPTTTALPQAAAPPTAPPTTIGAIGVYTPETAVGSTGTSVPSPVGTGGLVAAAPRPVPTHMMTVTRPVNNDGLWIQYLGEKWVSAGSAVPLTSDGFRIVGNYNGFPVFGRRDKSEQIIYVPTVEGFAAPYRLKQ
jgi:hypothetical protein